MTTSLLSRAPRLNPPTLLPEIEIHGRHSADWTAALDPSAQVWTLLGGIALPASDLPASGRKRVVVPLMERHIASMPRGCYALAPAAEALHILADKGRFARYAEAAGLAYLAPKRYALDHPIFPAMLKRTDLSSGRGIALVTSMSELRQKRSVRLWAGHRVVLQELIPARVDFVTHVVCVAGRIVWHQSYAYPLAHEAAVRGPVEGSTISRWHASEHDIHQFEKLLRPLGFNGPANIDYRRRADGSLAVLEINPRLGGSLMRPDNVHDLAAALGAIVRHAIWRPAPVDTVEPQQVRV